MKSDSEDKTKNGEGKNGEGKKKNTADRSKAGVIPLRRDWIQYNIHPYAADDAHGTRYQKNGSGPEPD